MDFGVFVSTIRLLWDAYTLSALRDFMINELTLLGFQPACALVVFTLNNGMTNFKRPDPAAISSLEELNQLSVFADGELRADW